MNFTKRFFLYVWTHNRLPISNWKPLEYGYFLRDWFSARFLQGYVEYLPETQENRYDRVENWDKSGEIVPFKGGIMISYKL
jgi:hypothetical protein